MLLLNVLFWIVLAFDLGAILLVFVLGLAAAAPSHTNPLSVTALLLIAPAAILAGLAFWFVRANSMPAKLVAMALAASPLLFVAVGLATTGVGMLLHPELANQPASFRPVSLAELESAVLANDARGVTKAAAAAGLRGRNEGAGVIILALHRLEKSPEHLPVFRALLEAGADPNSAPGELPLEVAIRVSPRAGIEPIVLLLDAGAKPNARNPLGEPAFFAAAKSPVDTAVLKLLLDRGADSNAKSVRGDTALSIAQESRNTAAVRLLLERGAH